MTTPRQEVLRLVCRAPQSMPSLLRSFRITGVRSVHMPTLVDELTDEALIVLRGGEFHPTEKGRKEIADHESSLIEGNARYSFAAPTMTADYFCQLTKMQCVRSGGDDHKRHPSVGMRC